MSDPFFALIDKVFEEMPAEKLIMVALQVASVDPDLNISEYDRTHVGEVLQSGDWWGADMLRLIKRSDQGHRAMLSIPFASYVMALEEWEKSGGEVA